MVKYKKPGVLLATCKRPSVLHATIYNSTCHLKHMQLPCVSHAMRLCVIPFNKRKGQVWTPQWLGLDQYFWLMPFGPNERGFFL